MNDMDGLNKMRASVEQAERDIKKMLNSNMGKLKDVLKQAEVQKEKRAKILKRPCKMQLMTDGNVRLVFDDPNDAIKIFE